jgi:hypothetical protein
MQKAVNLFCRATALTHASNRQRPDGDSTFASSNATRSEIDAYAACFGPFPKSSEVLEWIMAVMARVRCRAHVVVVARVFFC